MMNNDKLPLPVGVSDFTRAVSEYYYIDKTLMLKDIVDTQPGVLLMTRPRRFGKTLNMSMIQTYFEKTDTDTTDLFRNLNIWECGDKYRAEHGKYPVIFISLKDVKCSNWVKTYESLRARISIEYTRHSYLLDSNKLINAEKKCISAMIDKSCDDADLQNSLALLSIYLNKHYGVSPIILIDEYDTPIQSGYMNSFYNEVIEFMRNWLSGGLKDNPNLKFAVLTGILRVAKESIFSELNNLKVCTILDSAYRQYFGFTEDEVKTMAEYYDVSEKVNEIKEWYDGYNFGDIDIYNPWSVINYFDNNCRPDAYWLSTSSNDVIHSLLEKATSDEMVTLRGFIENSGQKVQINTAVIYPDIGNDSSALYSFLLMTGYLKVTAVNMKSTFMTVCELAVPNKEITEVYKYEILSRLSNIFQPSVTMILIYAVMNNDIDTFHTSLSQLMKTSMSYNDTKDEVYYQGFMLGLCAMFTDKYYLTTNREAGDGRFDLQLMPKDMSMPGVIMEFKSLSGEYKSEESLQDALDESVREALIQIESKQYNVELIEHGCKTIFQYGIAFYKKTVSLDSKIVKV